MLSSLRKCLATWNITEIMKFISFLTPRRRHLVLLFLISLVIATFIFRKSHIISNPAPPAPEYEEYTYTTLVSKFRNSSVINPHPYKYLHTPSNVCATHNNPSQPEILILVKSDATHFSYRMGIRSTWGNFSLDTLKIVFLLGYSSQIQNLVDAEYKQFHDLVQEDFIEAYRNNTIKSIMAFNWAVQMCQRTKFLLFVDDDYFVNVNAVTQFLKINGSSKHLIAGFKMEKARVFRYIESKWYMPESDYPFLYYPPYISGGAMLMSMTAAMIVQNAFPYVKTIPIDDVYVGIVTYLLNLNLTHDDRFLLAYVKENVDSCLAAHDYGSPDRLIQDWKLFLRRHEDNIAVLYRHQMKDILNQR